MARNGGTALRTTGRSATAARTPEPSATSIGASAMCSARGRAGRRRSSDPAPVTPVDDQKGHDVTDARELGFDPARLARLDKHLARYVDDGRLAGWQVAITRGDAVVHESTYGWR